MKRMALGFGLALLTLLALPVLPDSLTLGLRLFTALAIVAYVVLAYFAYVPVKATVGLVRLLSLTLGCVVAYLILTAVEHLDFVEVGFAAALALGGIAIAAGPLFPYPARKKLYIASIVALHADLTLLAIGGKPSVSIIVVSLLAPASGAKWLWFLSRWGPSDRSWFVQALERNLADCWKILAQLRYRSGKRAAAAWEEREFCASLVEMRKREATSAERYDELIRLCHAYPTVPTAWRLAYSAAISRGDRSLASELVSSCEEHCQREVLDIFKTSSPDTPWLTWRHMDKRFEEAQDHLSSMGLPLETAGP